MKIVFISNLYPPLYLGGYELRCYEIAQGLRERGHQVSVVTSTYGVDAPQSEGDVHRALRRIYDEISPEVYAHKMTRPQPYWAAQLRMRSISRHNARVIAGVLDQERPDVAYVWNLEQLTISPLVILAQKRIPCVFSLGDRWLILSLEYYLKQKPFRRFIRRVLTGVGDPGGVLTRGIFLPNGQYLYRECIAAGFDRNRTFVLPRGVKLPPELPPMPESDVFRILFAGKLCEDKGLHTVIKALGKLRSDPNIPQMILNVAGDGPQDYVESVKQEVRSLGIQDMVHFLGQLSPQELREARADSHAFVFPSIWEDPFPVVLLEAMASGLPIIGSPVGGAAEMLADGENSITFPPGDDKALAAAIRRLMDNRNLVGKLREGAWRTVTERFEFNKLLLEHERYLIEAVQSQKNK